MAFNVRILLRVILTFQLIETNADDGAGREREVTSPKEQVARAMNLSGKKTRIGRNSGECCISTMQPPKGIAYYVIESIIGVTFRCKDRESR
jgi:hypothetical protein